MLNAREELKVVEQDREELDVKRRDVIKEYDTLKQKTKKLRDIAAKKLNSQEQKEILNLLLKNFEFEIKNIEMQADLFKRDFKLREQDMVILRLEQHRSLCDTLIFQQRRLIVENNLSIPSDLNELYFLYSRDVNDGQLMKDLSGVRSTSSNSSLNTNSPKPQANAFLTQIQEENGTENGTPIINDVSNRHDHQNSNNNNGLWKRNNNNNNNDSKHQQPNNKSKRNFKDHNYQQPNNFHVANGATYGNGTTATNMLAPQNAFFKDNKNNSSMLSSSTNDSNMEIVIESNGTKSLAPRHHGKNGVLTSNNALVNTNMIIPPGQVVPSYNNGGTGSNSNSGTNSNPKRLTQSIAAIAAQRKATQHHRDLMQEMGQYQANGPIYLYGNDGLTASRLAKHDQSTIKADELGLFEKKNSILTDGSVSNNYNYVSNASNKSKKQVKIKDIVQFKLPEDPESHNNNNGAHNNGKSNNNRRTNSDSPDSKRSDENGSKKSYKYATKDSRRSKCNYKLFLNNLKKNLLLNKIFFFHL